MSVESGPSAVMKASRAVRPSVPGRSFILPPAVCDGLAGVEPLAQSIRMRIANPFVKAGLAFAAVVLAGGWLWFDWDARLDGFAGHADRRAGHAAGILSGAEWKAMRAAGDDASAASGGDACTTEACRVAEAQAGGLWAGGGSCAEGDRYRFADGYVEVASHKDGKPVGAVRRGYRVVAAPVTLRLLRTGTDGPSRPPSASCRRRRGLHHRPLVLRAAHLPGRGRRDPAARPCRTARRARWSALGDVCRGPADGGRWTRDRLPPLPGVLTRCRAGAASL